MNRKALLNSLGGSLLLIALLQFTPACHGNRDVTPRVDFTLDLSQQQYSVLDNTGGQVYVQQYNVLVAKGVGGYIAVTGTCTYDNCDLTFSASTNDFICPCCQSRYYSDGRIEFGPASIPLFLYATTLYGNSLRVYNP